MPEQVRQEILDSLDGLSNIELQKVLDFLRGIKSPSSLRGKSGKEMRELIGLFSSDEIEEMEQIIEEG